jgi:hypothetical protein
LTGSVQKLSDFTNTSDVLSTIFDSESETSVQSLSNDITIEAGDSAGVASRFIEVSLHGFSKSRFTAS